MLGVGICLYGLQLETQLDFHKDAFYCEIIQSGTELNYLNGEIHPSCFLSLFGHPKNQFAHYLRHLIASLLL